MRFASLFSGIGGFENGLNAVGHETALMCEIDAAAQAVLRSKFPDVRLIADIRQLSRLPRGIEALCAGFPCQDLSQAGRAAGLKGTRSGLISEVFRLVTRDPVRHVVLENVPFMLQLAQGAAMRQIADFFEAAGYRWGWRVVDTWGFGLPQRRERVTFVASRTLDPATVLLSDDAPLARPQTDLRRYEHGFYWTEGNKGLGWAVNSIPTLKVGSSVGIPAPPAIVQRNGRMRKPDIRDAERLQGFASGWTSPAEDVKSRSARWSLVGNAVSVPVARWIGSRLLEPRPYDRSRDGQFPIEGTLPKAARFDGKRRYAVEISTDPVGLTPPHLHRFRRYDGTDLSARATRGFLERATRSALRFPEGFLDLLRMHLARVTTIEAG